MQNALCAWLALSLTPGIGASCWRRLLARFGNVAELEAELLDALEGSDSLARQPNLLNLAQLGALRHPRTRALADQALEWQASAATHRLISPASPQYPLPLSAIADPPRMLYARGRLEALTAPHVAIIGARKASRNGCHLAHSLAADLSDAGLHVVSGLALGIDAAAHRGCLDAGGLTIAFAATPVDRVYPKAHDGLATRIVEQGLVLSEFPLGTSLQRHCFPRRNRLISGLCPGVVVIEAGLPSGSLTTALHALRQGREVMAVPGSPTQALARGCHSLIRDGATLVENRDQIIQCLHGELQQHLMPDIVKQPLSSDSVLPDDGGKPVDDAVLTAAHTALDSAGVLLLQELGHEPLTTDELVHRLSWSPQKVLAQLSVLELAGLLHRERGGRYARCAPAAIQRGT